MRRIKLGVDLDDTIWEFQSEFLKFYNNKFNKNFTIDMMVDYSYENSFEVSTVEVRNLLDEFSQTSVFLKLPLIKGVLDFFNKVEKNYEIYFITSRSINKEDKTLECFFNHFGREEKIHFIGKGSEYEGKSKGEVCLLLGVDYMIDDHFENLISCNNLGIKSFLITQPWNKNFEMPLGIIRVSSLKDCLKYLGVKN